MCIDCVRDGVQYLPFLAVLGRYLMTFVQRFAY